MSASLGGIGRVEVAGSRRSPFPGAVGADRVPAGTSIDVLIQVRRRRPLPSVESLGDRYPLSREEFAEAYGGHPDDIAAARSFAESHGLRVRSTEIGARLLVLTGTVSQLEDAFGVELVRYEHSSGGYRGFDGSVTVPAECRRSRSETTRRRHVMAQMEGEGAARERASASP